MESHTTWPRSDAPTVPAAGEPLMALIDVSVRFGSRVALDRLSLPVEAGRVVGLLGPNGAGKTTIINLMAGLVRPSAGTLEWRGRRLTHPFPPAIRRCLGLLPQDTALYGELTAAENLRFAADVYGLPNRRQRVAEMLDLVGLEDRAGNRAQTLSGGMQRRLALARALLHDPELLILDEPTLGVDIDARHAIWGHIRRLRRQGKTVVLSTNYLDEAEALCDWVVALREGHRVAEGAPELLLSRIGRCIEIDCHDGAVKAVRDQVQSLAGVERVEEHDYGLTVRLAAGTSPEPIATAAVDTGGVQSVRVRAPDLVEVFDALSAGGRG
jgi:ABC-2 type transport system ATP-binding protein